MNGYYRGRYECYATTATASFEAGRSLDDKWSAACDTGLTTLVHARAIDVWRTAWHLCGWIERIPGGIRENDGLDTGIKGGLH